MNRINNQANAEIRLKKWLASINKNIQAATVDEKEVARITIKLLGGEKNFKNGIYQGGVNKEELLIHLEEGLKKGDSKEVIIKAVIELFGGQENFVNGKFTGGWNKNQDLNQIKEIFNEKNFNEGKYIGDVNFVSENINKSLIPYKNWEQTEKEINQQTNQAIETKLGGSNNFDNGVYKAEEVILQIAEKGYKNKGPLLRILRDIMGEKEFFDEEPSDGIPPGREGMRRDPEAIALQNAEKQARIDAIAKWRDFYEDHSIVDSNDKLFWSNTYGSSVKTAEGVYKDAILKAAEIVGEDKPLNDLEKNRINKATIPNKIKEILDDIPKQRRIKEWNNFFEKHDLLNNIDKAWYENWTKGGLSIEVAKLIYNNGWYNNPEGLIGNDKKIESYTTETDVKSVGYKKTIKKIDPLKHLAKEVKKAHDLIVKEIDLQTDLNNFPTDDEIKKAYDETAVPDTINYEELRGLRDKTIINLFKQYFQEKTPITNLKDNEIELWRTSSTGLPNTGKDQRIAYDNGWINPKEIKDSKTNYQGIIGIEVLKVNKQDVDAEIQKVNNLVQQINSYKFLRELDTNQASIDKQFQELKTELLPPNKEKLITEAVQNQRNNLYYSLLDPKDGGLEKTTLERLTTAVNDDWKVPNYEPITVAMLNKFIAADNDVQKLGLLQDGAEGKWEDLTESGWLKDQGGYEIEKKFTKMEDNLHRDQKGAYLLKVFYEKARDGKNYPFEPDKLEKGISFCRIGEDEVTRLEGGGRFSKAKEVKVRTAVIGGDKGTAGHLAIGTGVGKTTKLINCLVQGGNRHVILVCPTTGLVDSAFGHHTSWLQKWGCVYHGGAKGKTEMEFCLKNTFTKATDEDIASGKEVEKEKKNIYVSHGAYPVAKKNDLAYWYNANTNQKEGMEEGKKGLSIMYFGNLLGFAARNLFVESKGVDSWSDAEEKSKVKQKQISKEDTIIVFDEAHFNDAGYQALQFEMINAGYDCLRMSATFPKTPFSTTSTYPMKRMFSGKLDPKMPAGLMKIDNAEQAEIIETMRGAEVGSIKFQDEKGLPIPVEVNLEERIRAGKTWYFSKSLQLNDDQIRALGSNVKYTIYSEQYDENCEDVSFGQPYGSLGIVDGRREMGYTPDIDTVICSGATETTNLGKYFTYSDPVLGFTPISSLVQQMGRSARIKWGLAISLTKKCMEMDISDNVSAAMVKATFDGNTKQIEEKAYQQIYDVDILRGALAYPSPSTFGKAPEEILMGLRITEKQQSKKEKIAKLDWRKNTTEDQAEALDKPWFAKGLTGKVLGQGIDPSEDLWKRYVGEAEKVTMDESIALDTLKEMISNFITQDNSFPQGLNLKKQEKMIGTVFGKKLELSGGKEDVVHETRTVLNGLVGGKVNELSTKDYDDTKKQSKNPNTIKKLAGLYKLADASVDYKKMENPEGKEVWTLLMKT